MRRTHVILAVIAIFFVLCLLAGCKPAPSPTLTSPSATPARALPCTIPASSGAISTPAPRSQMVEAVVVSITDGDTIRVQIGGETRSLRYIGVDAPERNQPGYEAANDANRALVMGQTVWLERDRSDTDVYSRLLRYVWLTDGRMVNEELVRSGFALAVTWQPDTRHRARLEHAALEAWRESRGFWAGGEGAFPYAMVAVNALAVHAGPDDAQPVKGAAMCGDALAVYGRTADGAWLEVRAPDRTGGWVRADGVQLAVPVDAVAAQ